MADLLNKLGSKSKVEGSGNPEPNQQVNDADASGDAINKEQNYLRRGADLLDKAGNKTGSESAATEKTQNTGEVESKSDSTKKEEPSGESLMNDPDSWTLDSAFKEIKKLREENKQQRLIREQEIESLKNEMESRIQAREQKLEEYRKAKKELDSMKEKEADKKRSLEEKLADRESRLVDIEAKFEAAQKTYEEKFQQQIELIGRYESEIKAQEEVYKQRLNAELASIPEKFRSHAELLVEGAKTKGDFRDALIALNEAKIKGMFDDKTVVVNHNVPTAHDGARATKEKLDEAARAERNKMTPSQKIGEALKQIKSGVPNSAFRLNK